MVDFMAILFLLFANFGFGITLGVIWKRSLWFLFAIVAVVAWLGSIYVAEFPSRAAIFADAWSFVWFLINYGTYFGLAVLSGLLGLALGLVLRKLFSDDSTLRHLNTVNDRAVRQFDYWALGKKLGCGNR